MSKVRSKIAKASPPMLWCRRTRPTGHSHPIVQELPMAEPLCQVLMVFPRFNPGSFWNYRKTCEMAGARYPAAPLGLITVAALLPTSWTVRLVNRNTEELTEADLDWADLVMTGGMLPQQFDTLEVIAWAKRRGKPVVVGGPDVTSSPHAYGSADFRVLGEAESVMDDFIAAWRSGVRSGTFEAPKFQTDVTRSPIPRFDLLKLDHYLHVGVQFSRGCPFTCEFCDIIELYGRKPRVKTSDQMLAELEALYQSGYRGHVDFVDDNFVGNKKALKAFLPELVRWQAERGHPFEFSTEASINLADDPELLHLMAEARFFALFVGIESPDPDTLVQTQKKQNTRRSLPESIHRLFEAGMFVTAGFIVGFDSEKGSVAGAVGDLIKEAAIPVCMVGLLYALPNTQLTRRLEREGRLHPAHDVINSAGLLGDQCTAGLNFDTKRPRAEVLADYRAVLERVYAPEAYFGRVAKVGRALRFPAGQPRASLTDGLRDGRRFLRLLWGIHWEQPGIASHFWRTLLGCLVTNPKAVRQVVMMMALYPHLGPFSLYVIGQITKQIEGVESGAWSPPSRLSEPLPAPAVA